MSCSAPRVLEVSSHTRLQTVAAADRSLFVGDAASRLRYQPRDLPADEQRQEFFVRWRGAGVDLVKFECRQVDRPNTILEQTDTPTGRRATVFEVRGEDFRAGGPVSAWHVSLWRDGNLLAEKKSALW